MAANFVPLQPSLPPAAKPSAAPAAAPVPKAPASAKDRSSAAPSPFNTAPAVPFAALCPSVAAPGGGGGQPVITVKKEGDRVVQIRVQCVCGQIIELACDY